MAQVNGDNIACRHNVVREQMATLRIGLVEEQSRVFPLTLYDDVVLEVGHQHFRYVQDGESDVAYIGLFSVTFAGSYRQTQPCR